MKILLMPFFFFVSLSGCTMGKPSAVQTHPNRLFGLEPKIEDSFFTNKSFDSINPNFE